MYVLEAKSLKSFIEAFHQTLDIDIDMETRKTEQCNLNRLHVLLSKVFLKEESEMFSGFLFIYRIDRSRYKKKSPREISRAYVLNK